MSNPAPAALLAGRGAPGTGSIVSGQIGLVDGAMVPGGVQDELRQAITNLSGLLAGRTARRWPTWRKTTVFLRHMRDYPLMNEIYAEAVPRPYPARSAVAVSELPVVALVEIEAWAWTGA